MVCYLCSYQQHMTQQYLRSKVPSIQQREKGLSSAKMKILERGQRTHNTHNRLPVCVDSEFSTMLRSMHTVMLHHYTQQYMVYLNKSSPSQHAPPDYYHYHYPVFVTEVSRTYPTQLEDTLCF